MKTEEENKMTILEKVAYCQENNQHRLSTGCIRSRIGRNWSLERIISTSVENSTFRPGMNHPFKRLTFNRVARKKGWEETPEDVK